MSKKINKIAIAGAIGLMSLQVYAANPAANQKPLALTNNNQKLSYTIGFEMGQNFKSQKVSIEPSYLVKGLKDGLQGHAPSLSKKQRQATIAAFQKDVIAKEESAFKKMAAVNEKQGKTFLAKNAKQPGVKTLPDGLQYKIIKAGTGPKPTIADTVTVNYRGAFLDGTVFDSSYKRGKPATFPLTQVIKGWQQALTMMPAGTTMELWVPPKLAYGERGMGRLIGPNKTLMFKIELISIANKNSNS